MVSFNCAPRLRTRQHDSRWHSYQEQLSPQVSSAIKCPLVPPIQFSKAIQSPWQVSVSPSHTALKGHSVSMTSVRLLHAKGGVCASLSVTVSADCTCPGKYDSSLGRSRCNSCHSVRKATGLSVGNVQAILDRSSNAGKNIIGTGVGSKSAVCLSMTNTFPQGPTSIKVYQFMIQTQKGFNER